MLLSSAPAKLVLPFAATGSKNTIPAASQIGIVDGAASLTDGFPPLTRTPKSAGGKPVDGLDMNGILFELSDAARWANAGGGYVYDAAFATDSNVGGYPKGAVLLKSGGNGWWLNTVDSNTTNPDESGAGWVDVDLRDVATAAGTSDAITAAFSPAVTALAHGMTLRVRAASANTTTTPTIAADATAAKTIVKGNNLPLVAGDIAGSGHWLELRYDATLSKWVLLNPATGVIVGSSEKILSISAVVAANALTVGLNPTVLDFRSATLSNGVPNTRTVSSALSLVVPSGATLGTVSAIAARLVLLAIDNGGTVELAVVNLAGGNNLDETTLISTTAISAGATAVNVIYSTTDRSNVPFRVVGFIDITEATAGTWASAPTTIQGQGGQAMAAMQSIGYGQTWQLVTRTSGVTYYNTTGKPIQVKVSISSTGTVVGAVDLTINGVSSGSIATAGNATVSGSSVGSAIIPAGCSYMITDITGISLRTTYELR